MKAKFIQLIAVDERFILALDSDGQIWQFNFYDSIWVKFHMTKDE